jgi:pSer/pThr/pTyr-binding forkhead associated (FHA) protein
MATLWINVIKVGFVAALYLFLWFVARSIARHLSRRPAPTRAVPAPAPPGSIVVAVSDRAGTVTRHIEVRGPLVVGRGDADVVIDDPFASDRHLRLDVDTGRLAVEDLGSTNGTLVNDVVIHQRTIVARGDRIRVGTTTLEVT